MLLKSFPRFGNGTILESKPVIFACANAGPASVKKVLPVASKVASLRIIIEQFHLPLTTRLYAC